MTKGFRRLECKCDGGTAQRQLHSHEHEADTELAIF